MHQVKQSPLPEQAHEAAGSARAAGRQTRVLVGINTLYIGFGLIMGIINGGMPTILRNQGMPITSAGWLYLLYLPFGLTFLWAPLIDRVRLPFFSQHFSWILSMQTIAVALLLVLALSEGLPGWQLFALGVLVSLAIATMDLALDAIAVKSILPGWRPTASATKLAALALGAMLGGGVFVAIFDQLGWQNAFFLLALTMVILLLPALPLARSTEAKTDPAPPQERPKLVKLLSEPASGRRLLLLTLVCCIIFPLAGLNRLMLVDLGVSIQKIGWIVGTLGPLTMIATSAVAIPLMRFLGLACAMTVFAFLALFSVAAMGYGVYQTNPDIAMAGSIVIGAGVSGIYVTVAAKILGWANGPQPATDYAAYYGISRFASTLITAGAASLIALTGWGVFYTTGGIALILVMMILRNLYSEE